MTKNPKYTRELTLNEYPSELEKSAHETIKTIIHSNGGKWAGEKPDTIEQLIEVLKTQELDIARAGAHGFLSFIDTNGYSNRMYEQHTVQISGGFKKISHNFNIEGVYQNLETLIKAIEENIQRQMDRLESSND